MRGIVLQYYPYISYAVDLNNHNMYTYFEIEGNNIHIFNSTIGEKTIRVKSSDMILYRVKSMIHRIIIEEDSYLFLHSACISYKGNAFVLLGQTNAGKSSLCTYLTSTGMEYLTDDCSIINLISRSVVPFRKIIQLRADIVELSEKYGIGLPLFRTEQLSHPWCILPPWASENNRLLAIMKLNLSFQSECILRVVEKRRQIDILSKNLFSANEIDHKVLKISELTKEIPVYNVNYSDMGYIRNIIANMVE